MDCSDAATPDDVPAIAAALAANQEDLSLFQRSAADVLRHLGDFVVVRGEAGALVGTAALKVHSGSVAEILSLSVVPEHQGAGVGRRLVEACERRARELGVTDVWLGTVKTEYFARFGYASASRWRFFFLAAGPGVVLRKLGAVFQQPRERSIPALFGRHAWMLKRL